MFPRCGAWTWGKVPQVRGLTNMCYLKAVSRNQRVTRRKRSGVVSGWACAPPTVGASSVTQADSSTTDVAPRKSASTTIKTQPKPLTAAEWRMRNGAPKKDLLTKVTTKTPPHDAYVEPTVKETDHVDEVTTKTRQHDILGAPIEKKGDTEDHATPNDCLVMEEDVDYWTGKDLGKAEQVTNAVLCRIKCENLPKCDAWTWGKVRETPGLTNTCFLKAFAFTDGKLQRRPKTGVVSGVPCRSKLLDIKGETNGFVIVNGME